MAYGRREPRGGDPVTEDELRAAAAAIERALQDAATRRGSAAALLDRLDQPAAVREAIRARVEVSAAATADRVGADELAGLAAFSDAPSSGIAGGNQALALALAAALGDRLHLSSPVAGITWDDDGLVLRTAGRRDRRRRRRRRRAGPAGRRDRVRPDAPRGDCATRSRASATGTPRSCSCRCASARRRARCSPCPSATGRGPRAPAATSSRSSTRSRAPSPRSIGSTSPAGRIAGSRRSPGCGRSLRSSPIEPCCRRGRTTRGRAAPTRSILPGGDDPALAAPHGPLVLAGEYTAGPWAALMEGALRSGARAAEQVIARVGIC